MLDYTLSIEEFEEMIKQPEFEVVEYDYRKKFEPLENLTTVGCNVATMFEELAGEHDRMPTQQEYVEEGLKRAKEYFTKPEKLAKDGKRYLKVGDYPSGKPMWYGFEWNKQLIEGMRCRIARSYPSHAVEYSTILTIKNEFPQYRVGANDYLDYVAGIDFCVGCKRRNKVLYVHVTNASKNADYWFKQKGKRKGKGRDPEGNMHDYERNFNKGHAQLSFSHCDDEVTTRYVNGIPIIRKSHIERILDVAFNDMPYMDSFKKMEQLHQLDSWLKDNEIDPNGLGKVWI